MADINSNLNLVVNVKGGESVQNLKTQIREAKKEVEQFEEGSEGFINAAQKVAQLSDRLDDVNSQVKLLKGDALERVAGGFKGIGSAIMDLDVGRLQQANMSLKSIPFKDLMGNVKDFGKELLTLATNPLFLIPAAIGLIIANFDKLMKIFPGLGTIVEGVKVVFEKLVGFIVDGINYAGELYEKFKPVVNILTLGVAPMIESIIDLLKEEANSAEASSKRRVEAEAKYKDSIEESNKSLGESRRRILVLTGKLSEEEAEKQRLKEDFITNYLKAQEEARVKIKEAASNEEKAVIDKDLKLRLEALSKDYTADLMALNKSIKDKSDAEKKAAADKSKKDAEDRQKEREKKEKERLDELAKEASDLLDSQERAKIAGEKFTADMKAADEKSLNDLAAMADAEINLLMESNERKAAAEKSYTDMIKDENQKRLESEQKLQDLKFEAVLAGFNLISDLTSVFAGKSEKAQRRAFNIQKGLSIATTTIETYLAAQKAYTSQLIPGDPTSPVRGGFAAAIAIAGGLARVAKIAATKFEGGGSNASGGSSTTTSSINSSSSSQSGSSPVAPPVFNLGGQQIGGAGNILGTGGGLQAQQPVKVFVSETDISNVQNKVKVTEGNSLFGSGG